MAAPKQGLALPVSVPDRVVGFGFGLLADPLQATANIATVHTASQSPVFRPAFMASHVLSSQVIDSWTLTK